MRLTEIAKDAVEKVRAIFRKPDQEKEKKAEAAGKMIKEAVDKAGKMTAEAMRKNGAIIGTGLVAGKCRMEDIDLEEAREAFRKAGYDMDRVTQALIKLAETITETMKPYIDSLKRLNMDKWQIAKMEMSNNEKKKKKLPMVRRRGYIRAEQLKGRSKK